MTLTRAQAAAKLAAGSGGNETPAPSGGGGGFGFGLGNLGKDIWNIVPGLVKLGVNVAKSPFSDEARHQVGQVGKGALSSVIGTAETLLPIPPVTNAISNFAESHGLPRPENLWTRANQRGLLPAVFEDTLNVAMGAGAVAKAAKFGAAGRLAESGRLSRAAFGAEEGTKPALAAAKAAEKAAGQVAAPEAVASRMRLIGRAEKAAHPFKTVGRIGREPFRAAYARNAEKAAPVVDTAAETATGLNDAALAPEAPPAEGRQLSPDAVAPRVGPAEEALRQTVERPIPEWATKLADRLPEAGRNVMSRVEGSLRSFELQRVARETERFQEGAQRASTRTLVMKAGIKLAEELRGTKLRDGTVITRDMASNLVGDEIMGRLEVKITPRGGASLPDAQAIAAEALGKTTTREGAFPTELMTPEMNAKLDAATALAKTELDRRTPILEGARLNETQQKALSEITGSQDVPEWSKAEQRLYGNIVLDFKQLQDLERQIAAAEAIGTRLPDNLARIARLPGDMEATVDVGPTASVGHPAAATTHDILERAASANAAVAEHAKLLDGLRKKATRIESLAKTRLVRLTLMRDNPSFARTPAKWQPMLKAVDELLTQAERDPVLADVLGDLPRGLSETFRYAAERGFDPTHVRNFSDGEVRQLAYGATRLSRKGLPLGRLVEADTLKQRVVGTSRARSLDALRAGVLEVTQVANANHLVDVIDTLRLPIEAGKELPPGMVAYDPIRHAILTGEEAIKTPSRAAQWMVPDSVARALRAYSGDTFDHGIFRAIQKATNPWRAAVLTFTPRWYVNNFWGQIMLAIVEGVKLRDWRAALKSYKTDFADTPEVTGHGIVAELGGEHLIPRQRGIGFGRTHGKGPLQSFKGTVAGIKEAAQAGGAPNRFLGGPREVGAHIMHNLQRMNAVVDDIARSAVYHKTLRTTGSTERALMQSYKALVDYGDLRPIERSIVRSMIPFYSWQKGILKLTARLPIDHPLGLAIASHIGRINEQQMTEQGLPDYYHGLVDFPGLGTMNTRPLNPFADSAALTSPQGIFNSVNPYVSIFIRNAVGAPVNGFVEHKRVNEFGTAVPTTDVGQEAGRSLVGLPQFRALGGGSSGLRGYLTGVSTYSPEQVKALIARKAKGEKAVADQETANKKRAAKKAAAGKAP